VRLSRRHLLRWIGTDALAPALRTLGRGLVSIFTLHRFTDPELDVVGHDPAALRGQLAYLRRHRYRLLSMTDVVELVHGDHDRPMASAVAFTVDDGYLDFARIAAPIFAEFDCPVTLFVPTGFVDGLLWLWWDRVAHLFSHSPRSLILFGPGPEDSTLPRHYHWSTPDERDRVQHDVIQRLEELDATEREVAIAALSRQLDVELPASPPPAFAPVGWEDITRTARLGATFGPHTVTHRILTQAPAEACAWEIQESYRRLRERTDACVPVFSYPAGRAGPREREAVQQAGCKAAVTATPGYVSPGRIGDHGDGSLRHFSLPRFPGPEDRPALLRVVSGLARLDEKGPVTRDRGRNGRNLVSPARPPTIVYSAAEGVVERTAVDDSRFKLTLIPRHESLYVPLRTCETAFPPEVIRLIASKTPFAWLCDAIARHEDPGYVGAILQRQLFAYFSAADFAGARLLDFGCGSGASTFALAAALPRTEVIGVELNPASVEIAERIADYRNLSNVRFLTSPSGTALPVGIGQFDFIVFSAVYEHLLPMERKTVMPLIWSALKPRGVLFINQTPYRYFPYEHHSTKLWFINYLPDRITHWLARRYARHNPELNGSADWNVLLRGGIRGGTEREILGNLGGATSARATILQPHQSGLRDRADYWLASTSPHRMRPAKRFVAALFRVTDRLFGTIPSINVDVVIQKT